MIAGIDFSTKAVDVVLLDEDTDAATWHRFELHGDGAFDRTRSVRGAMPGTSFWDDVLAVGIEEPCGHGAGRLMRIQGAILACIPTHKLVHPLMPSAWRKTVGLPGNASKDDIDRFVLGRRITHATGGDVMRSVSLPGWPQDACDAYCIALATRTVIERVAA